MVFVPSIAVYSRDNKGEQDDHTVIVDDDASSQTEKSPSSFTKSSDATLESTSYILRSISSSPAGSVEIRPYQAETDVERRVESVLSQSPLIDGHNDLAYSVRQVLSNNLTQLDLNDLEDEDLWVGSDSNTDIRQSGAFSLVQIPPDTVL